MMPAVQRYIVGCKRFALVPYMLAREGQLIIRGRYERRLVTVPLGLDPQIDLPPLGPTVHQLAGTAAITSHIPPELAVGDAAQQFEGGDEVALPGAVGTDQNV